ncbi:MAG TPA: hypothetical protein VE673_17080 [Pseudonocardiaceae bacterium]|nr:hypothetical protein [Pseudonocardiaceae bacterium]
MRWPPHGVAADPWSDRHAAGDDADLLVVNGNPLSRTGPLTCPAAVM